MLGRFEGKSSAPWEEVFHTDLGMMERTSVPGGWIYRNWIFHSSDASVPQISLVFVPTAAPIPPSLIDTPYVSGNGKVGETLACTQGNWDNEPTSYAYQWRAGGNAINGATGSTYLLSNSESNKAVDCIVTATNAAGSVTAPPSNAIQVANLEVGATSQRR